LAKAQSDYSALQARAAATATIVKIYESNARNLEEKGLIHQDLTRAAKTSEENYLLYLRKQEEARMADALDEGRILNVAVAESPNVPLIPPIHLDFRDRRRIALGYGELGIVFTVEYMDSSFRTPSEVISELNIPCWPPFPGISTETVTVMAMAMEMAASPAPVLKSMSTSSSDKGDQECF